MQPLILLDRDGTLVREADYPNDPKRVRLLAGVPNALRALRKAGFRVLVITNQSGVARGRITQHQLLSVNRRFLELLKASKSNVDGLYWCPHQPVDHCACRKPKLGLVKRGARTLGVSWKKCISVGDRETDVALGQRTGGKGILVLTGYGKRYKPKTKADHVARNFSQAVTWILKKGTSNVSKRKTR